MICGSARNREAATVERGEIGDGNEALVQHRFAGQRIVAVHGKAAQEVEEGIGIKPGRGVFRLELEARGVGPQAIGDSAIGADLPGDDVQAGADRGLEIGRLERGLGKIVEQLEAALGETARGQLGAELTPG